MVVGLVDFFRGKKKGMMIIFPHVLGGDAAAADGHDDIRCKMMAKGPVSIGPRVPDALARF